VGIGRHHGEKIGEGEALARGDRRAQDCPLTFEVSGGPLDPAVGVLLHGELTEEHVARAQRSVARWFQKDEDALPGTVDGYGIGFVDQCPVSAAGLPEDDPVGAGGAPVHRLDLDGHVGRERAREGVEPRSRCQHRALYDPRRASCQLLGGHVDRNGGHGRKREDQRQQRCGEGPASKRWSKLLGRTAHLTTMVRLVVRHQRRLS
jgi:hypothetical protein